MAASDTQTILEAMQTVIVAGVGTGSGATHEITSAKIVIAKLPWVENDGNLPGIILTPVPEQEKPATNASDDIGYGVQVTIAQTSNRDLTANADRAYYWRETIMGLFRQKRLSGVSNSYIATIEPKPVIDPTAFSNLFDATAFVVRVWTRKQRPS